MGRAAYMNFPLPMQALSVSQFASPGKCPMAERRMVFFVKEPLIYSRFIGFPDGEDGRRCCLFMVIVL
jgi:hypothetical protein